MTKSISTISVGILMLINVDMYISNWCNLPLAVAPLVDTVDHPSRGGSGELDRSSGASWGSPSIVTARLVVDGFEWAASWTGNGSDRRQVPVDDVNIV